MSVFTIFRSLWSITKKKGVSLYIRAALLNLAYTCKIQYTSGSQLVVHKTLSLGPWGLRKKKDHLSQSC